jgi:hypothetical protein
LVPTTYDLADLPWGKIAGRLEQVAIAVLRLDARLAASGLSAGWQSRCDLTEAARSLILDGHVWSMPATWSCMMPAWTCAAPIHELTWAIAACGRGAPPCSGQPLGPS